MSAGLFGSLSYAGITSLGVTPRKTILTMLFIPCLMVISFILLPSVHFTKTHFSHLHEEEERENAKHNSSVFKLENKVSPINDEKMEEEEEKAPISGIKAFLAKIKIVPSLLKYMIPLFLVYV
jgi:battenin